MSTVSSPFFSSDDSVQGIMLQVLLAMLPGVAVYAWFFGVAIWINVILATVFALMFEALVLKIRKRPLAPALTDGSAIVTARLHRHAVSIDAIQCDIFMEARSVDDLLGPVGDSVVTGKQVLRRCTDQ